MHELLRVLLVDQNPDGLATLKRLLTSDTLEIVGEVGYGPAALTRAQATHPDVILVATDEPLVRALATVQALSQGSPAWTVVSLVAQFERDVVRKAVLAGARDVLVRGTPAAELREALFTARQAHQGKRGATAEQVPQTKGTIVSVFGVKGGIGKTTIATNLALTLAQESKSVALVDLEMQFGDVALMLDIHPDRSVKSALDENLLADPAALYDYLIPGPGGVHVLPSSLRFNVNGEVDSNQTSHLLTSLASLYDFVVVDMAPIINEVNAAALDTSTLVLLITTPEVTCLRRTHECLRLLQEFGYSQDRLKVVLNRAASRTNVDEHEAEQALGYPISWRVANDHAAMKGAAYGKPVALAQPRTPLALDIRTIAAQIAGLPTEPQKSGWAAWIDRLVRPGGRLGGTNVAT